MADNGKEPEAGQANDRRALVVYYSRTETTHKVALEVARAMGAEIERIADGDDRAGVTGYMRSGKEASTKAIVPFDTPARDPAAYDLVIVGTPVWAWTMCSPVRSYLTRYGPAIRNAAFFCTAAGRESLTLDEMAALTGKPAAATMVVYRKEVRRGAHLAKVQAFVSQLADRDPVRTGPSAEREAVPAAAGGAGA